MNDHIKIICPVDPTCTFFPKAQCDRPFYNENACWLCNRKLVRKLREEIAELKRKLENESGGKEIEKENTI
jgi:hypothetical protein